MKNIYVYWKSIEKKFSFAAPLYAHKVMQDTKMVNFLCNLCKIGKVSHSQNAKTFRFLSDQSFVDKVSPCAAFIPLKCWRFQSLLANKFHLKTINCRIKLQSNSALQSEEPICQNTPRCETESKRRQNVFIIIFTWLAAIPN